jgi:hypothetical protein
MFLYDGAAFDKTCASELAKKLNKTCLNEAFDLASGVCFC